ncbi:MAG: hypothetical protein PHW04_11770 [Candidatus Wallbacteria bacterium]|nr:hypothetical protein [Candidatus Wallbacteria bacterium]
MLKAKKDKIRVAILTKQYKIKGELYLYENSRLSDILNADQNREFIALTDVKLYSLEGDKMIGSQSFAAINRSEMVLVYPDTESLEALSTYLKTAQELIRKNAFDSAIAEVNRVIAISPDHAKAHYILGIALGKKHQLNEALQEFEEALRLAEKGSDVAHMAQEMINQIKI